MGDSLKSYVEKYLLNPGSAFATIDDEGNEETHARVDDIGHDNEKVTISKLRMQNTPLLAEKNPKYRGKKISRGDLHSKITVSDPELQKYLEYHLQEESSSGDDSDKEEGEEEENVGEEEKVTDELNASEIDDEDNEYNHKLNGEFDDDEIGISDYLNMSQDDTRNQTLEFMGDSEEEEEEDMGSETKEEGTDNDDVTNKEEPPQIQTLVHDEKHNILKGLAVTRQLEFFDSLFEIRIGLQKILSGCHQLPRPDTYRSFLDEANSEYNNNIVSAKGALKRLLENLIQMQNVVYIQNSETENLLDGDETAADMRISEVNVNEDVEEMKRGKKRKCEEYKRIVKERHKKFISYRNQTLDKWYEKTRLLSSSTRKHTSTGFDSFEQSVVQQIGTCLKNKEKLVERTRMQRGKNVSVMAMSSSSQSSEHDPEVFDDTDFYSRMLEDVLKMKMTNSDAVANKSMKWLEINKQRREKERKFNRGISGQRMIKYEVINELQQYLCPAKPPQISDEATDKLFNSIFVGVSNPLKS